MKFLGLVWANLKRRKLRTILTVLSIGVAFLLYGFLGAVKDGFAAGVNMADAQRLIVRHKMTFIMPLPVSYQQRMASLPGVDAVTHMTWFNGIYKDPENIFGTFPVEPESYFQMMPDMKLPPEQMTAWVQKRNGAVVGRALADKYEWKIGTTVPLTSPIWGEPKNDPAWSFEVVGIYDGDPKRIDPMQFLFRYDFFDEGRQKRKGEVGWYMVRVKDAGQAAEVSRQIDELFANSSYETKAEPEAAFAASFVQQMGDIGTILMSVMGAVFFTILLVAGNTMGQAVRERTAELGVLKSLGFSNVLVLALVLLESIFIAAAGGGAGLLLAWGALAGGSPVPQILPILFVSDRHLAMGVGLILALGLAAGFFPAMQAMRLRIAEALRRNG